MDINATFKELAQYKAMRAQADAEIERLEKAIKDHMTESEQDTLIGDEHKATYKPVTSNRFDSKAFKADHGDMYTEYTKSSTSMRFTFA